MKLVDNWLILGSIVSIAAKIDGNLLFCTTENVNLVITTRSSAQRLRNGGFKCAGGLFFEQPTHLVAIAADFPTRFCLMENACQNISENDAGKWKCEVKMEARTVQMLALTIDFANEVSETGNQKGLFFHQTCSQEIIKDAQLHPNILRRKRWRRDVGLLEAQVPSHDWLHQTRRMFYFLANLNPESVQSPLRAVALLEKTMALVSTICDPNFLSPQFLKEVLRGFLFLLKEQGTEGIVDLEQDDFVSLTEVLNACALTPSLITFTGVGCSPEMKVATVSKIDANGQIQTVSYAPSESAFAWGTHDIVIDAVWTAISIVHGACFQFFHHNVNLHHKYQVSMEELFRGNILRKWGKTVDLCRNSEYDHMLLAPVNQTMTILDACVVGAYLGSPFRQPLDRPKVLMPPMRKRRSMAASNEVWQQQQQQYVIVHCFHTNVERENALKKFC